MLAVDFIAFLSLHIFFAQLLVASSDTLLITSDRSEKLFKQFPHDVIKVIVGFNPTSNISLYELKWFCILRRVCKSWAQALKETKNYLEDMQTISPMSRAFLMGDMDRVAWLSIEKKQSFLFERGQKRRPFEYALDAGIVPTMAFFFALYPTRHHDYKNKPGYEKAFYFHSSMGPDAEKLLSFFDGSTDIKRQLSFLKEAPLSLLQHFFYRLTHVGQVWDIATLANWFLDFTKNEYWKKIESQKICFLTLFFKSFFEATLFDDIKRASCLTNFPPYIFWFNEEGQTLMQKFPIDFNAVNEDGLTPLMVAIDKKNANVISVLLKNKSILVNGVDSQQKPPLYYAIKSKSENIITQFLNLSAIDVGWINRKNGNSYFHLLAKYHLLGGEIERLLCSRLKDPRLLSKKNYDGKTYKQINKEDSYNVD
jgi:hypothetical protein